MLTYIIEINHYPAGSSFGIKSSQIAKDAYLKKKKCPKGDISILCFSLYSFLLQVHLNTGRI